MRACDVRVNFEAVVSEPMDMQEIHDKVRQALTVALFKGVPNNAKGRLLIREICLEALKGCDVTDIQVHAVESPHGPVPVPVIVRDLSGNGHDVHAAKFPRADTEPYPPLIAAKKSPDAHNWNGTALKGECTKCKCTREARVNSMTGMDEVHYRRTGILYINRPPPCTG